MTDTLGFRIKSLRKKRGLSQEALAQIVGLTRSSLTAYEIDRTTPPSEVLTKLSKTLGTSSDYLLGLTDSSMPSEAEVRFVNSLDLDNDELLQKFDLKVDGQVIPPEHLELAIGLLRSLQQQRSAGK
ncbi:helix-turn-helix domain-containing protein [Paenibacillus sp. P22]|uniref:helix-turn-helix domain-containing protein n=1 Tax=Paenibacillus sp. P22 TaxID=483908 RepID=UPI00038F3630|nr:Uncharacterized HTH-type transcriptional regulator YobD [Paenibacillus sp. P22]